MRIIDGRTIADTIKKGLVQKLNFIRKKPCLAVVLVGCQPASCLYLRIKERAGRQVGIKIRKYLLSSRFSEEKILQVVRRLNQDSRIDGILIQLPLPKKFSPDRIIREISLAKDVDGLLPASQFSSPFILAIWRALQSTKENLRNKKIVALVNSDIFGRRLIGFLKNKGLPASYLTKLSLKTRKTTLKKVDVLITALGRPNFINESMVKKGVILIDGGISQKGKKIIGDINRKSISQKASWLSPVPGGIGPITVAQLLENVVLAAKIENQKQ